MSRYQPPFTITPFILNQVVEIGELLGHWAAHSGRTSPLLRKENRIRTIQASLAIEHNSLTTGQVTAIMDGKRVLAPEKDIQEVRNAILAYENTARMEALEAQRLTQCTPIINDGSGRSSRKAQKWGRRGVPWKPVSPHGSASLTDEPPYRRSSFLA